MYTFSRSKEGYGYMASSVAPPCDHELDPGLFKLRIAHLLIANGLPFAPYADRLTVVDHEQIDRARLQFFHVIQEICDTLYNDRLSSFESHDHLNPLSLTLRTMLDTVEHDLVTLEKRCDNTPKNSKALTQWLHALDFLAQGALTIRALHHANPGSNEWSALHVHAEALLQNRADHCAAFRARVGVSYPVVLEALPAVDVTLLLDRAKQALTPQITTPMDLSYGRLMRARDLVGSTREALWHVVSSPGNRKKAIENGTYKTLMPAAAEQLRENMTGLMYAFDHYRVGGFVNALRTMGQYHAFSGAATLSSIHTGRDLAEMRDQHKREVAGNGWGGRWTPTDKKKAIAEFEKTVASLPDVHREQTLDATARLAFGLSIDESVRTVGQALGLLREVPSTLTLSTDNEGITVGHINDDPSRVLLAYPDPFVSMKNAIYAFVAPSHVIKEGLPAFSKAFRGQIKEQGWPGTNFVNIGSFMTEMAAQTHQEYLLGKTFALLHKNPGCPTGKVYPQDRHVV